MFNLDSFLKENSAIAKSYAENLGISKHDAEDVVQIVFSDFSSKFNEGKIDIEKNPRAYLFQLLRWRTTDKQRENNRRENIFIDVGENNDIESLSTPKSRLKTKWRNNILQLALLKVKKDKAFRGHKCSLRDCSVFGMTVFDHKTADEISDELKTTKATVYLARHRVGQRVKEAVKEILKHV